MHQVLREIWRFKHELQARNFGQHFNFWGILFFQQTVHKLNEFHPHFQIKSKREGRNNDF